MIAELKEIVQNFSISGEFLGAEPYGSGHINDTFASVFDQAGTRVRYIHQRINQNIFRDIELLMRNIEDVTGFIREQLKQDDAEDISRRCLTLVPTLDGGYIYRDSEDKFWRTYFFVENASTYDVVKSEKQAYEAARAFGEFQYYLGSYNRREPGETIPDFHNTPKRLEDLKKAFAECDNNRDREVHKEMEFILEREEQLSALIRLYEDGKIRKRITHNDTKLNNVLIDNESGEGLCVIDLDTVMPGFVHYDFGDLIRTSTSPAAEDEEDVKKIFMQMGMYKAIADGFCTGLQGEIRGEELETLPLGALLITIETGIRFLTDFLQGDKYFKIHREKHNLIRCRAQIALAKSIEEHLDEMREYLLNIT